MRRRHLAGAALLLAAPAVQAQAPWPDRPVRIIVPFPPGQSTDIVARLVADELSRRWPQRVVVENRAGGAGVPAMEAAARSAPDGATLVAGSIGPMAVNAAVIPRLSYDPERDFTPITNLTLVPLCIVAHPSFPANDPAGFLAAARAATPPLAMATAGPASGAHMAAELLAHRLGITLNMVHYRGSAPAITDLVAGTVPLMTDSLASALPNVRAGRLKLIGVSTRGRVAWAPDVPSFAETIAPGHEAVGWNGLAAPAGLPPGIVARINADVTAVLRDPAAIARIEEAGMLADPQTPEQFAAFLRAEIARWREVARIANVTL
ncbi:Bug family tripartite tricarboxylate transporter substrate binding protein [Sediminicoccus sp. BL-A-41-H5]|uniref:Bug family tripartite tricarboxylate transporter substrate binding protein n=1 Tax=Sediminicoccus sp. BL-A-41-H5 TaxID=3421106 RepID=UPI003D66D9CE